MAKYPVNLSQYQEWKQRTKGGLTAHLVRYKLFTEKPDGSIHLCFEGELPVCNEHRQKVKQGWYSSAVLAALDEVNFPELLQSRTATALEDEIVDKIQVKDDTTIMQLRPPTFQVVALDECDEMSRTIVYVEGRV